MKELTDKQKSVFDYINEENEKNGFPPTIREIANFFCVTPKAAHDHMKLIEKKGFIRCHKNRSRAIEILNSGEGILPDPMGQATMVPLLGTIAAGTPLFAEECIEEYVPFPKPMTTGKKRTFALRVRGDSMIEKGIHEGDLALIEQTNIAENGDIVVALLDDEATLKIFMKDGKQVKLVPANKKYKPIVVKNLQILGKLVGILRYY